LYIFHWFFLVSSCRFDDAGKIYKNFLFTFYELFFIEIYLTKNRDLTLLYINKFHLIGKIL